MDYGIVWMWTQTTTLLLTSHVNLSKRLKPSPVQTPYLRNAEYTTYLSELLVETVHTFIQLILTECLL